MKFLWKCPILFFTLMLMLSPVAIAYEWNESSLESEEVTLGDSYLDTDVQLMYYLEQKAGIIPEAILMGGVGDELTGIESAIYASLKNFIQEVAAGTRQSTEIKLRISELGDYTVNRDELPTILQKVRACLIADCPYDLFWYDYFNDPLTYAPTVISGQVVEVIVRFPVHSTFRESNYQVKSDLSTLLSIVQENARKIVDENVGKSDYRKLEAYKDAICDMVVGDSKDNLHMELINAFDGNPDTNIACGGYSKAFKYLCDLSSFSDSSFSCYLVAGKTSTGGSHMWNHVTLNGNNYLIDVTMCDGMRNNKDIYFLWYAIEGNNTADTGYTIVKDPNNLSDTYTLPVIDYLNLYDKSASFLTLSTTPFAPIERSIIASGSCGVKGDNVTYTLDNLGVLIISGSGDMANYPADSPTPWENYKDNIVSVQVENGVTSIGNCAFKFCSLISAGISSSVKSIGDYAFSCSSLKNIDIPEGVTTIATGAFRDCESLESVSIPTTVTSIGKQVFCNDKDLISINLPEGISSIEDNMFYECVSLPYIRIPNGVNSIGYAAFYKCESLVNISIPQSVTSISEFAFQQCENLKNVTLSDNIAVIGKHAFSFCPSLEQIVIPRGVTAISDSMFRECTSLAEITIPSGIEGIGYSVFYGCTNLHTIYYSGTVEQWNELKSTKGEFNAPIDSASVEFSKIYSVNCNSSVVTANILNPAYDSTIFCVFFNNSNQMISIYSDQITTESTYEFQCDDVQFDYAKVFILDDNLRPLCRDARTEWHDR